MTQCALANKAELAESVMWNALHGGNVRPAAVQAIAKALVETPLIEGAALLVDEVA